MTMSGAFNTALSGLAASARGAAVVSENVSNARTEGYAKRRLELAPASTGGGVQVTGIARRTDPLLIGERRGAGATAAAADARVEFLERIERAIGLPGDPGSLGTRLGRLETSLIDAASRPDAPARLQAVAQAAADLARGLNDISREIQDRRVAADRAIATAVEELNGGLREIAGLNIRIAQLDAGGQDASALMDRRRTAIDAVAELVPVREIPRENGRVALYSEGGAILLDSRPADLGFSHSGTITPAMTLGSGGLSGLELRGRPVETGGGGPLSGGRLAALFAIRDESAPSLQAQLDAVARDLADRLGDPATDPTLGPAEAGVLTDAGARPTAAAEAGLAARIAVNPAVMADPWRLRDGLGAAAQGDPGDGRLLAGRLDALQDVRAPASAALEPLPRSASALAGDLLSAAASSRHQAETRQSAARAELESLRTAELAGGVDTDEELQALLKIEQSYAANARVLSAVDEMMGLLTRI